MQTVLVPEFELFLPLAVPVQQGWCVGGHKSAHPHAASPVTIHLQVWPYLGSEEVGKIDAGHQAEGGRKALQGKSLELW